LQSKLKNCNFISIEVMNQKAWLGNQNISELNIN
jgi:hypothetical protein